MRPPPRPRLALLRLLGGCALDLAREAAEDALGRLDDRLHELVDEAVDSWVVGAISFGLAVVADVARGATGRE